MTRVRFDETDRALLQSTFRRLDDMGKLMHAAHDTVYAELAASKANEVQLAEEVLRLRQALQDANAAAQRLAEHNGALDLQITVLEREGPTLQKVLDRLDRPATTFTSTGIADVRTMNPGATVTVTAAPRKRPPRTEAQKAARRKKATKVVKPVKRR